MEEISLDLTQWEKELKKEFIGMVIPEHTGTNQWVVEDVCYNIYPHSGRKFIRGIITCADSEEKRLWFEIIYNLAEYKREKQKAIEEIKDQIALKNKEYPNLEYHMRLTNGGKTY